MGIPELLLIAAGLSMDAFAAAVCKGLALRRPTAAQALTVGAFFGGFQALMPLLGWLLGRQFQSAIADVDHWVAFALLTVIGGHMIADALRKNADGDTSHETRLRIRELLLLSVATSIDALAVGVTFALLPGTDIRLSVALIGAITFALSTGGVFIGGRFGARYEKKASIAGGVILIAIGVKIVCEHLFGL